MTLNNKKYNESAALELLKLIYASFSDNKLDFYLKPKIHLLKEALSRLDERTRLVIELYAGLTSKGKTLEEIGSELNLTQERIRHLKDNALNDLGLIILTEELKPTEDCLTIREFEKRLNKFYNDDLLPLFKNPNDAKFIMTSLRKQLNLPGYKKPIPVQELPVRIRNNLLELNILTYGDLYQYSANTLLKLKNFGTKSFRQLNQFLNKKGYPELE